MTMPPPEISNIRIARSAGDIRAWIVSELSRSLNADPASIDTAAALDSLGVDSLMAIGMTGALAAWLKRDLPATLMWEYGSIDAMAEALADSDATADSGARPGLIPLQPQGERLPLFCFPGMGGHPAIFSALAMQLRPTHPCYGLVVPGLGGECTPFAQVEEIAAAMLENIRRVQPSGPYQLAGYSFGGLLAYETAQQLTKAGETVSMLAIYDTFVAGGRILRPRWQRVALHAWLLATRRDHLQYVRKRLQRLRLRKARPADAEPAPAPHASASERHGEAAWLSDAQAAANYRPVSYPGSILLFRATERAVDSRFYKMDPTNGWGALAAGGVLAVDVPGTHGNMLDPAHASVAAGRLQAYLSEKPAR